jgi:H+-translocating NAD(P) transhydrogenase subunit alpha
MTIAVLKEISPETRVALTPETVQKLTQSRVNILVEQGAGENAHFRDSDYIHSGAAVITRNEILEKADCILTLTPLAQEEVTRWKGKILIGALDPYKSKPRIDALLAAGITSFSLDLLPRTTMAQSMDILSSMATVSGYRAVLDAATRLPRFFPMFMSAAGTIKPAMMLILGAGVAGLQAIATARRLGAVVEVFDVRSAVKEEVQSLGGKFVEVEGAREDSAAGGYAIDQTEEFLQKQRELIHQRAVRSDVIICTAVIPGRKAPTLLYKRTVEEMKGGSVIIDLAASSGGNCELTKNNEIVIQNRVTIVGKTDYYRTMPIDASYMVGHNFLSFLQLLLDDAGNFNLNWNDEIINTSCLTRDGEIINRKINQFFTQYSDK